MLAQRLGVGITGHQDLNYASWVEETLDEIIETERIELGVTSLAKGADQIFAQCMINAGRSLRVVVPSSRYEEAFEDASSLARYLRLSSCADEVETMQFKEPSEAAFLAAGKRIVDVSAWVIAVWNGQPAKGPGGTADIVDYAGSVGRKIIHINCDRRIVSEIT